jgi:uncharacterized phage protein (TIGR01671 family)
MNRQIKFRIYSKDFGMQYPNTYLLTAFDFGVGTDHYIDDSTNEYPISNNGKYLMQFTGLHDKNGVPIYEGDVISFEDDAPGEVKWNQQFSCFTYFEDENINDENEVLDWSQLLERHKEHYIVLGNIHEHPNLLK